MEPLPDPGSPVSDKASDSGYESGPRESCEPPGELVEQREFVLQARVVFVTYSRSQVEDKEVFFQYLQESIKQSLPRVSPTEWATVEIFGSKELHEDGVPHYHVVLRFSKKVHWRKAREKLAVTIEKDGERVIDTQSIYIRRKRQGETQEKWLQDVQGYVAKDGDVFGTWIGDKVQTSVKEKQARMKEIIDCEWRHEAEQKLREHFPEWYIKCHTGISSFLKTKKAPPAQPHTPEFEVLPWRVPVQLKQWRQRNFSDRAGKRPTSLVIIGPPKCGKTEWALSFGKPAMMNGGWDVDQIRKPDITHLVLNDIHLKGFPHKQDLAGCQTYISATGKYRDEKTLPFGKPVIWTCNPGNSVMKDRALADYLEKSGATVVRIKKPLYVNKTAKET